MRYAIPIDHSAAHDGGDIRLTNVVDIPNPLPLWATDAEAFLAKMFPDFTGFIRVADDAVSGATKQQDGSYQNPLIALEPGPNNLGNPYFGKQPLETKDFYGLVGQALSAARFKRLLTDSHFLWVGKVLDHVDHVDPDDKAGQFLKIIAFLQATDGDDAAKLITAQEVAGIMGAWPV